MNRILIGTAGVLLWAMAVEAKVDLVTLPARDSVQLTIYNSADLTLARDRRDLTLREGANWFQFSWANTLIDPTSLELEALDAKADLQIQSETFPPRTKALAMWEVQSGRRGKTPVEISYLTSGLAWYAFYMGILAADESVMRLEGYVRVINGSGEDYENAQVRLVVGEVHLIDQLAELARRANPYGRPELPPDMNGMAGRSRMSYDAEYAEAPMAMAAEASPPPMPRRQVKQILKEGLSEYFLYTIEGRETIPNGWSKRLPSFTATEVPVINLYRYDEERYGYQVTRLLSFTNDTDHRLGQTPIPGGMLKVYRDLEPRSEAAAPPLVYEGQSSFKYIPVGQDVELDLGPVQNVYVDTKVMNYRSDNYMFDGAGDISGWDEVEAYEVEVRNTRPLPVTVEVYRHFASQYWTMEKSGEFDAFEQVDLDTVKFTLQLPPRTMRKFAYEVTTRYGLREEQR